MVSNELQVFVNDFVWRKFNKTLSSGELKEETTLKQIDIEDLDFDLFMFEFIEKFKIDDSSFESKKYFGIGIPLIDNNVDFISKIIGNRKWLPLSKDKRKSFTLKQLEDALRTGSLY